MRDIEPSLPPDLAAHVNNSSIEKAEPFEVRTYGELMSQVAQLAYLNKDFLLFFRGQAQDHMNRAGSSTFYPSIYRDDYLPQREVFYRFYILEKASKLLVDAFERNKINGYKEVRRKRFISWSILQHYEICATPLLDLTHSVRVACSFAQLKNRDSAAYVFVFALPYITNRISINSEHDIVNVRLLSICPPDAMRPYYQDGYLAGTADITTDYETKTELDFKNRLVAKFKIPSGKNFWGKGLSSIPDNMLYPKGDKIDKVCRQVKIDLDNDILTGDTGEFLKQWAIIEELLHKSVSKAKARNVSTREAIRLLVDQDELQKQLAHSLDTFRRFRNQLVRETKPIDPKEIREQLNQIMSTVKDIKMRTSP